MTRLFLLHLLALVVLCPCETFAAVIYTQISVRKNPDGSVPFDRVRVGDWWSASAAGATKSLEFDVDGDGSVDFGLYSTVDGTPNGQSFGGVYASPKRGVEILGCPYPPPYSDPDNLGVGMPIGSIIGFDSPLQYTPATGVVWGGMDLRTGRYNMLTAVWTNGQAGTFYVGNEDVTGYLAFRLLKEDGWHYGWLEAAGGFHGLEIFGIAWETDPNKAIVAGLIPEASSTLLALCGVVCSVLYRKRTQVRRSRTGLRTSTISIPLASSVVHWGFAPASPAAKSESQTRGPGALLDIPQMLISGWGRLIRNFVSRPGVDETVMVPPCASTARFTIERPRPVPLMSVWE